MHLLITPRRRLGVALSAKEVSKAHPVKADVHMREQNDERVGRTTMTAYLFSTSPRQPEILPRLIDASVTGLGTLGMNISGIEEVDGAFYFQSWWCRFE